MEVTDAMVEEFLREWSGGHLISYDCDILGRKYLSDLRKATRRCIQVALDAAPLAHGDLE